MTERLAIHLDGLDEGAARRSLLRCCGSERWVDGMLAARPFARDRTVFERAAAVWESLDPADWREAFAAHPRIGERGGDDWSRREQAGAAAASDEVRRALEVANREYEQRFRHVFLICASGLDGATMLAALRRRLDHDADTELQIAAAEQAKITRLRLTKLAEEVEQGAPS